jgi:hypothetical protein
MFPALLAWVAFFPVLEQEVYIELRLQVSERKRAFETEERVTRASYDQMVNQLWSLQQRLAQNPADNDLVSAVKDLEQRIKARDRDLRSLERAWIEAELRLKRHEKRT